MAQVRKFDFATDPNGTFKALIDYVRVRVTKRKLSFRLTRAGRTIVIPVLPPTGGSEDFFDVDLADGDDYCTRVRFEESSVYFTGFGRQFPGFFFWLFFSDFEHLFPNIPKPQQRSRPLGFKGRYGHELLVYGAFMGMGPLKTAIRILSRATNDRATFNKLKPHLATIAFMIGESARSNDIFLRFLSAEEDELVQCTDWMWSMVHCWGDCSYDLECNYMNESQQVRDQKCLLGAAGIEVDEEKAIDKNDMRDLMIQNTALLKDQESKILKLFGSKGIPVVTGMPKAQPSGRVLGGSGGEKRLRDGGRKAQPGPPSGGVGTRKHKELLNSILWNEVDAQVSRKRQKLEPRSSELIQNKDIEMTPVNDAATKKAVDSGIKNRQCSAFIELKGRQCVRWANDGDIYCCVHLASRFTGSSTKAEARPPLPGPMCEGTTVLGTQCKHRSLPGSSFCKMHRVRTDAQTISNSTENTLKRKYDEIITSSETANCKDMVLMGEVGSPLHMDRVSVGEACQDRVHLAKKLKLSSQGYCGPEILHSIGSNPHDNGVSCCDSPKRYSLYCDKHIPSWLKRARNGKSGIISKENFLDLLKECCSLEQKLHLHQACELFYKLFKSGVKKYVCRFCGLNFYLLPDLGGHHQAAHVDPSVFSCQPRKRGVRYHAFRLQKVMGAAAYRMGNATGTRMKKQIQASKSLNTGELSMKPVASETGTLGRLAGSHQCSSVAKIFYSEIQTNKPRPHNQEVLTIAHSACCRVNLNVSLEGRYGVLPKFLYLKATKLCIEHNIQLGWPQKGFIFSKSPSLIMSLIPPTNGLVGKGEAHSYDQLNEWKVDECHYIIDLHYFREGAKQNATVLRTDKSHSPEIESLQLGCSFSHSICDPGICNRAHLFYNGYEVAKDIYGKPMGGTFAYDDRGRNVSKEGYLVYECNRMCGFSKTCLNRVLQIGIRGWAVRAGEPIVHGTFGFECAWEVLDEREEEKRLERYGLEGVSYMYNVDAHGNDMSRWIRTGWIGIDATKYGNVSGVHQARVSITFRYRKVEIAEQLQTTILPVHIL